MKFCLTRSVRQIESFDDTLIEILALSLRIRRNKNRVRRHRPPEGARLDRNDAQSLLQCNSVQFQRRKLPCHVVWIEQDVDAGQLADRLIDRLAVARDVHVDRKIIDGGEADRPLCLLDALAEDVFPLRLLLGRVSPTGSS